MIGIDGRYASPAYRDGFLTALDRHDGVTLTRLAQDMTNCANPLPSGTCKQLGIPLGSTYGFAARRIVALGTGGWIHRRSVTAPGAWEHADADADPAVLADEGAQAAK